MLASHGFFELRTKKEKELLDYLEGNSSFGSVKNIDGLITAYLNEDLKAEVLNKILFEKGIILSHLSKRRESLEEQFLALTNNSSN